MSPTVLMAVDWRWSLMRTDAISCSSERQSDTHMDEGSKPLQLATQTHTNSGRSGCNSASSTTTTQRRRANSVNPLHTSTSTTFTLGDMDTEPPASPEAYQRKSSSHSRYWTTASDGLLHQALQHRWREAEPSTEILNRSELKEFGKTQNQNDYFFRRFE